MCNRRQRIAQNPNDRVDVRARGYQRRGHRDKPRRRPQQQPAAPRFERHERFPKGINTEFIKVLGRDGMDMRVWERGSGETAACGTGACAAAVAGVLTGRTDRRVLIHLAGGDLTIEWRESDNHVAMRGEAVEVFRGEIDV